MKDVSQYGNKVFFIRKNVTVRHGDNEDRRQNQLPAIFESFKEGLILEQFFLKM